MTMLILLLLLYRLFQAGDAKGGRLKGRRQWTREVTGYLPSAVCGLLSIAHLSFQAIRSQAKHPRITWDVMIASLIPAEKRRGNDRSDEQDADDWEVRT